MAEGLVRLPSIGSRLLVRAGLLVLLPSLLSALFFAAPFPALDAFLRDPGGTRLLDRRGGFLAVVPAADGVFVEKRGASEIPDACRRIVVRLEDARFFHHPGVDGLALVRAVAEAIRGGRAPSGASTITMQLARIAWPRPRSLAGKLGEIAFALRIEARLAKGEILDLYLNSIPFGRNTRGIGGAAWTYFGRDLSALSEAELLALAVIPRNPAAYDPFRHPDALAAAALRLSQRWSLGIGREAIGAAIASARTDRPLGPAPHFARYAAKHVAAAGAPVRTALDAELNRFVEARVRLRLEQVRAARITNAAVIVLDNATGEVLAWVGSRDWGDSERSGQIDGVLIRRQVASTLKAFLYGLALDEGWTAATLLPDADIGFGTDELYRPVNFDRRSRGPVRLRTALASSLNVPAVFTLSRIGTEDFAAVLRLAGLALPADAAERYGLGAAAGNVEANLLELARAFSVFPRGGTLPPLSLVRGEGSPAAGQRVFTPQAAWVICSILSDPAARAAGFGTRTWFRTGFPAMFKSGTSSEFTNLWCLGATPRHTVGVWAGNFDGRAVINKTGSVVPARIVVDILERLTTESRSFAMPPDLVERRICAFSGGLATARCPAVRTEYFSSRSPLPLPCRAHEEGAAREEALLESFLRPGEAFRILFPVDGQVVYLDPTLPARLQGVPIVMAARRGEQCSLSIDGVELGAAAAGGPSVPARRGLHRIVARSGAAAHSVSFRID